MKFDLGHINKVAAVSVHLDGDRTHYNYLILKKAKGEIEFGKSGKRIPDLKALHKEITNRIPVLLHFTGKGILNRSVKKEENYRHSILLNANLEDFYFTDYLEADTVFSSVVRKSQVDEIVDLFNAEKVQVISISSGPFLPASLAEFISKEEFIVNQSLLKFDDNTLVSFSKTDERGSISLGNDRFDHEMILCVGSGAQFFNSSDKIVLPESEEIFKTNFEEARQKNVFFRFAMGMMIFFLSILTANYFYLDYLNNQIVENYGELIEFEDQLAQLSLLEDERGRKEKLLQSSGLLNRNFLSFYLMKLSNSVPKNITFDEIVVRPLEDEIKKRQKIEFADHLILVSGQSKTSDVLSKWIDELKEEKWLAKVDIIDYTYIKNIGNFELEIEIY